MDSKQTKQIFERVLVVLDPGSEDGDAGVYLAQNLVGADGHVELAVALNGPEAWALRAFAESEEVSTREAADIYLNQTSRRTAGGSVGTTMVNGDDLKHEIVDAVEHAEATAAVLPAAMAARVMASKQNWASLPFTVLVVPTDPKAA